jgi:hypothetical protein
MSSRWPVPTWTIQTLLENLLVKLALLPQNVLMASSVKIIKMKTTTSIWLVPKWMKSQPMENLLVKHARPLMSVLILSSARMS